MGYYVFSKDLAQKNEFWVVGGRVSCLEVNLNFLEICVLCSLLEREKPRSSEGLCHTLERGSRARRA